jgi:predicted phage terminase large subunit-like protein
MKLTDTQLVLLSAASQREDCAIELAPNLKGGGTHKMVGKLLTEGLLEEIQSHGVLPVWRHDENKGPLALRITKHGLAAIHVEEDGALPEAEEPRDTKQGADLAHYNKSLRPVAAAGRKKTRGVIAQSDLFAGGSVRFPRSAGWLEEFIAELLAFPGRHDDQVDALTQGLAWGRNKRGEVSVSFARGMI